MLLYDDLGFESMAKYKAICKGDLKTFNKMADRKFRKSKLRQNVLSVEIPDLKDVEGNFNERDSRI